MKDFISGKMAKLNYSIVITTTASLDSQYEYSFDNGYKVIVDVNKKLLKETYNVSLIKDDEIIKTAYTNSIEELQDILVNVGYNDIEYAEHLCETV